MRKLLSVFMAIHDMLMYWRRISYGVLIIQDYASQLLRYAALNTDWRTS